jgi:Domain of unknown function (DUF4440)
VRFANAIAVLMLPLMPVAFGQQVELGVDSKVLAMESLKLQAYRSRDLRTLEQLLDQSFVAVESDGEIRSKVQVLLGVKEAESLQFLATQMIVRVHGDTAIVTGLYEMRPMVHGRGTLQRGRFVDTWLNRNGQWLAIASLSIPGK